MIPELDGWLADELAGQRTEKRSDELVEELSCSGSSLFRTALLNHQAVKLPEEPIEKLAEVQPPASGKADWCESMRSSV